MVSLSNQISLIKKAENLATEHTESTEVFDYGFRCFFSCLPDEALWAKAGHCEAVFCRGNLNLSFLQKQESNFPLTTSVDWIY